MACRNRKLSPPAESAEDTRGTGTSWISSTGPLIVQHSVTVASYSPIVCGSSLDLAEGWLKPCYVLCRQLEAADQALRTHWRELHELQNVSMAAEEKCAPLPWLLLQLLHVSQMHCGVCTCSPRGCTRTRPK